MGFTPTDTIWFNGKLVPWNDAKVHVLAHGLQYGTGVFEGMKSYPTADGPAIFRLDAHLERFYKSAELYDQLARAAMDTIDLDLLESLARSAGRFSSTLEALASLNGGERHVRVGVADDPAFCFYYPENLDLLRIEGAELVKFSPMNDQALPSVDMLYLGGGYPELHGDKLARNVTMRRAVRSFAERGGVIYAECGGMMYLTEAIRDFDGHSHEMVGLFPAEAVMQKSSVTLGYRTMTCSRDCVLGRQGLTARGHEFHHSTLTPRGSLQYACKLDDARGQMAMHRLAGCEN